MTDPKDELRARFDEQTPADDQDETAADAADAEAAVDTNNSGPTDNSPNSPNPGNTGNPSNASDSGPSSSTDATTDTDTSVATSTSATSTPGPDKDETATRHRRQVPMYLPDDKAVALNQLYERLDGRSKVAGDGGIEKHADFMEQLVAFAIEHEDELAAKLDIQQ